MPLCSLFPRHAGIHHFLSPVLLPLQEFLDEVVQYQQRIDWNGYVVLDGQENTAIPHEVAVSALSFIFFTVGLIFTTFGSGPGTTIGNLYFSTWLGFIVSFALLSECGRKFMEAKAGGGTAHVGVGSSSATQHTADRRERTYRRCGRQ